MERILVVEDDRAVHRALKRLFEPEGYSVDTAFDGQSGLEVFRAAQPSAVVLDLRGKTDLRQLIRLVYHAQGVLCPVTLAMHLAAAVEVGFPILRTYTVFNLDQAEGAKLDRFRTPADPTIGESDDARTHPVRDGGFIDPASRPLNPTERGGF